MPLKPAAHAAGPQPWRAHPVELVTEHEPVLPHVVQPVAPRAQAGAQPGRLGLRELGPLAQANRHGGTDDRVGEIGVYFVHGDRV